MNRMDLDVRSRFTESMVKHRALVMLKKRIDRRMAEVQELLDTARVEAVDVKQSGNPYAKVDYRRLNLDRFD